jgi:hypothetical protein
LQNPAHEKASERPVVGQLDLTAKDGALPERRVAPTDESFGGYDQRRSLLSRIQGRLLDGLKTVVH